MSSKDFIKIIQLDTIPMKELKEFPMKKLLKHCHRAKQITKH